jgi:ubiquinone/menaquinone biosynthesis C-methylase UbiE
MAQSDEFKDYFSAHASSYARHRPTYPPELFEHLASLTREHELAWDCGTGNGQAALGLAPYFDCVIATDASAEQIRNAFPHSKVSYRVARAERSGIASRTVDLVTVAQALHWFDIPKFYQEAKRVLKPDGVLAVWSYALCRVEPRVDEILESFYSGTIGPYWPKERKFVDDGYRSLAFPFDEIPMPRFEIKLDWALEDMLAYLRTWSPVRRYIERHGSDPVDLIASQLAEAWGDPFAVKTVTWPLYIKAGK